MSYRILATLIAISILFTTLAFSANQNNIQARVFIDAKPQLNQFYAQHLDVVNRNYNYFEIITNQDELNELEAIGFRTEVVIDDLKKFILSRYDKTRPMGG